jgi:hypothetical protein
MPLHHGHIIERIVRRNGHSISDVARLVNVNRRSIYNWFNLSTINPVTIYQIGHAIKHDFSVEFPDLFKPEDFHFTKPSFLPEQQDNDIEAVKEMLWKDRYIDLLERYTRLVEERSLVF